MITRKQREVLRELQRAGVDLSARQFATRRGITPAAAQMMLTRLLRAGLVSRLERDGRERWFYRVTFRGMRAMQAPARPSNANAELCAALLGLEACTISTAGERMGICRTAAYQRVQRASDLGLVCMAGRVRSGKPGGPVKLIALTAEGRRVAQAERRTRRSA